MPQLARLSALCLLLSPALAAAQTIELASQRDGVEIRAMDTLPVNPHPDPEQGACLSLPPLVTEGAKAAAAAHWTVTGEITQGELTFVSFVARTTAGTSGSCLLEGGNVGIFRGPELLGLVYAPEGAIRAPGYLQPLEPSGVRIWDGDYGGMPLADLRVPAREIVLVRPVAERDQFCGGAASLPSLYGLPIHQARILLLAEGWKPVPATEASPSGYVQARQETLPELQDCSGTGFGYCGYSYAHEGGRAASVTTAGEGAEGSSPLVVDFGVRCE